MSANTCLEKVDAGLKLDQPRPLRGEASYEVEEEDRDRAQYHGIDDDDADHLKQVCHGPVD